MSNTSQSDTTAAMKILALYGLLLFTNRPYSLSELAKKLKCSKQTVLRLVDRIGSTDYLPTKIVFETRGRENYYSLFGLDEAPPVALTPEKIQLLVACQAFVWHLLPKSLRDELDGTVHATTTLLPDFSKRAEAFNINAAAVPKGAIDYTPFDGIIQTLFEGLREHRIVEVAYQAHDKPEPKIHRVAPIQIVLYRDALYLRARLEAALADPKGYFDPFLAIQRMKSATLQEETFTPIDPAHIRNKEGHTNGHFGFMPGKPFKAKVRFDAKVAPYVRERRWSDDQVIEEHEDGGLTLEFTATSEEEVNAWVGSFAGRANLVVTKSK